MNVNASSLRNIDVFLFFNYGFRVKFRFLLKNTKFSKMKTKVRMQMQSMVKVSFSAPNGIYKAISYGDLKLKQDNTLESS